jgi:hypothetical protein
MDHASFEPDGVSSDSVTIEFEMTVEDVGSVAVAAARCPATGLSQV